MAGDVNCNTGRKRENRRERELVVDGFVGFQEGWVRGETGREFAPVRHQVQVRGCHASMEIDSPNNYSSGVSKGCR